MDVAAIERTPCASWIVPGADAVFSSPSFQVAAKRIGTRPSAL